MFQIYTLSISARRFIQGDIMSNKSSNKNLLIAILLIAVIGIGGYSYYQSTQEPDLSIDGKRLTFLNIVPRQQFVEV